VSFTLRDGSPALGALARGRGQLWFRRPNSDFSLARKMAMIADAASGNDPPG
jgi:hypothetical protein